MHTGSCLCGAVKFQVEGELSRRTPAIAPSAARPPGTTGRPPTCRARRSKVDGEFNVAWYRSSEKVQRGFCSTCGASLFWDPIHKDFIGVAMGAFDAPTDTHLAIHIYVADKGDYYEIKDGLPQNPQ